MLTSNPYSLYLNVTIIKERTKGGILIRLCKLLLWAMLAPAVTLASLAKEYSFSPGDISIVDETLGERTYSVVRLEGLSNTARDIGLPWLPFKDVIFIVPHDAVVESILITSLDSAAIKIPCLPLPMQYPVTSQNKHPFVSESREYFQTQWPGTPALLLRHAVSADANLAVLRLYPVQFDPRTMTLKLYTRIGVSIATKSAPGHCMPVTRDSLGCVDRISLFESLVENPEDVGGFLEEAWQASFHFSAPSREKMAIVTSREFLPAFDRLACWKTEKGCSTGVYTMAGSTPAELLGFIRDKVSLGCEFILLGGGEGVIPIRTSCYREPFGGASFTDLYYADCSNEASSDIWDAWNENHNQYYGEPYADHMIVKGVSFASRNTGWIAGNGRGMGGPVIVKTTDGGITWSETAFLELGLAYDLEFIDAQVGFVAGNFGIARTGDGGVSWDLVWDDDSSSILVTDIDCYGNMFWAVGSKDGYPLFLQSRDGGLTWSEVAIGSKELYVGTAFNGVNLANPTQGWVVGSNTIQRVEIDTLTGEYSFFEEWRDIMEPAVSFWGCGFFDERRGSVFGYGNLRYRLYTRSDSLGWVETTPDTADPYFSLVDLVMTNKPAGRAFAFGYFGYSTGDYGMNWTKMPDLSMPSGPRASFLASDPSFVWVAGEYKGNGANLILKSTDSHLPEPSWDSVKASIIVGDKGVEEWMPDVAVGRLPVVNLEEAQIAVDKIIGYEKNPPPVGFAERALFMSANMESSKDDFTCLKAVSSAASYWSSNPSREAWRLFNPLSGDGFSGDELLNSTSAVSHFESGCNFICHIDHGTAAQFGTGYRIPGLAPYNRLFSPDIAALENLKGVSRSSIVYTAACAVAQYTREVDPVNPVLGGNIAVEFLRNPQGGAVTFIGGVDDVDRGSGNDLTVELAKALLGTNSVSTGWALIAAQELVSSQSLAYNIHLLGDPSLRMYDAPLANFSQKLSWTLDSRGFKVTVTDEPGKAVSGADVCLYMPGEVYRVTRSSSQGEARFAAFAPPAGVLTLTVSARNFIPYQERILVGETSLNPLAVSSAYPGAKIAVDVEGRLHLVYTDSLYGRRVARYACSSDTGNTWSISLIDPNELRSTFAACIVLANGLEPYAAYLVRRGADSTTLRLADLKLGRRFDVAALSQKPAGTVSLTAEPGAVHIAVRTPPELRYYKVDPSTGELLHYASYSLPGGENDTLASAPAFLLVDSIPIVFADASPAPDSFSIYAWFPLVDKPFFVTHGSKPSVAVFGRSFTLAYLVDSTPRVLPGWLAQTGALHLGEELELSDSSFSGIAALGPSALILTGAGSWFAHENGSWDMLKFSLNPAHSPSADVNFASGIAAASWHQSGLIRVSVSKIEDFPPGHAGCFPRITVLIPASADVWPMEVVRPVAWYQTFESDSVILELSTDSARTFQRIAARGWREPGLHYFHWEVGRLADKTQIPKPDDSYPFSFIRIISGTNTVLSRQFAVGGEYAEASFASGSDPTGSQFYADSLASTGWLYVGRCGCVTAELELSLDGGETFSQVASGTPQAFWALPRYNGELVWTIPDTVTDSARLRLLVRDTLDDASVCLSGLFSIVRAPVFPDSIEFYEPVPNLFSDAVDLSYFLPSAMHVSLVIYDITGRLVTKLVEGEVEAGVHTLRWDGRDNVNRRCASGIYFVRFEADKYLATKKVVLIR